MENEFVSVPIPWSKQKGYNFTEKEQTPSS